MKRIFCFTLAACLFGLYVTACGGGDISDEAFDVHRTHAPVDCQVDICDL